MADGVGDVVVSVSTGSNKERRKDDDDTAKETAKEERMTRLSDCTSGCWADACMRECVTD